MHHNSLFNQPRIKLSLLYAGVMGAILLSLGYITHRVMEKSINRSVDRELHLVATTLNSRLVAGLQVPGQLPSNAAQILPELCLANQTCQPKIQDSVLLELVQEDYYLQLLDLQGMPIAAIGESPNRFPANPSLKASHTMLDPKGDAYHLHLMPLQTQKGQLWGYVQVGRSVQKFDDYMRGLHLLILFGVPFAMLMIGGASWWLAGLAMQPIYQAYEQMQQFTANAAHELRTPIASTKAILEVAMADEHLSLTESKQTLSTLHRQNDRLGRLAQDLLLLSRLDAAPATSSWAKICLNDLVQDLEEELAAFAMAAGIHLSSQIATNENLYIDGNVDQVYRLTSNLINNAIQYNVKNGKVLVKLWKSQNEAVIEIQDNGDGIAAADLPHLFDRFYRVESDRNRKTGGSGLGLAIAQAIAQAHNSQIQVQSTIGQGSTFVVRFPVLRSAIVPKQQVAPTSL
jgi:signal transduction histidine kinase